MSWTLSLKPVAARLARWARRHQTLSAGLAVLLMSAVIGAVVIREERARGRRVPRRYNETLWGV